MVALLLALTNGIKSGLIDQNHTIVGYLYEMEKEVGEGQWIRGECYLATTLRNSNIKLYLSICYYYYYYIVDKL